MCDNEVRYKPAIMGEISEELGRLSVLANRGHMDVAITLVIKLGESLQGVMDVITVQAT